MARLLGEAFVVIRPQTDHFRAETEAQIKRDLSGINPKVDIGADVKGLDPALAAMQAKLRTFSRGRVAFADLIDYNLPQSQIIGQLILLKRLVQRSGISDLIDFNLNTSQIEESLQKVAGLSATVNVEADTGDAITAVEALRARLEALGSRLGALRVNADTTEAQASIARLQARLEKIRDQVAKVVMTADTTQLDKQIAKEEAALATLQRKASDLQLDADTAKAAAKIAALEKQASDLYARLDHLEADVDVSAALTRIYAIEAELEVLKSDAKAVEVHAQTAQFDSAIAASEAKIAALKAQAGDIRSGATFDTAGLRAAEAAMLQLTADTDKAANGFSGAAVKLATLNADADKGTGAWARLGGMLTTTGVGWNATIGGVSGLHIVLDLAIEAAIAFGTALLALGAAAAATYPAIDQLAYNMQHMIAVQATFHQNVGPLRQQLSQLQQAMAPQVVEAFGGALRLVSGQTGALARTAHDVVNMIDTWVAKIGIWAAGQRSVNGILHTGTGYLAQFGKLLGILGQAISNLLTKDPGIARFLLDFLQGVAGLLNAFSRLPAPIVEATLAIHGLYLWGRVLSGVLLTIASGSGKAVTALAGLAANPLFWVAAAAAAIGYMAYESTQASHSAKAFSDQLNNWVNQMPASQAATTGIASAIGQLNAQIRSTNVASEMKTWKNLGNTFRSTGLDAQQFGLDFGRAAGDFARVDIVGGVESLGRALKDLFVPGSGAARGAANDIAQYRGEIVHLTHSQGDLLQLYGRLVTGNNNLRIGAVSSAEAFGLMDQAGVKASDTFNVMYNKVLNLVRGYQAMSINGGLLANSVNALNFATAQQDSKVSQLNSAWDTFFSTISGGASGFVGFATQMTGLYQTMGQSADKVTVSNGRVRIALSQTGQSAQAQTASMLGLNAASLQARNTFIQTAQAANTQMDNLTLLASAAGIGARGTQLLTQAAKDMVAEMLPAARGSQQLTDLLYGLAQRGGYQGANSFQALAKWVGNVRNPMQQLDGITTTLTTDASNLTKDVQNLSVALGRNLNDAMAAAILQANGGQKVFNDFANAISNTGTGSTATRTAAINLANKLIALTGNTKDAHDEFITFAQQLTGSRSAADKLWNSISGQLTPVMSQLSSKIMPAVKNSFTEWAHNGLDLSRSAATNLWSELTGKLGPYINNNLAQAVLSSKAKFEQWAGPGGGSGLGLTKIQAGRLYDELRTLQGFINGMHGKDIQIHMNGQGLYTITGSVIAASQGKGGSGNAAGGLAAGGRIPGYAPGVDNFAAMLSPGEFVLTPEAASEIGYDTLEHVNRRHAAKRLGRAYAAGGAVPGFAAGGSASQHFSGGIPALYPMPGDMQAAQTRVMEAAQIAAMKSALKSAEAAAIKAAQAAFSKAGNVSGYRPGAGVSQWSGAVNQALRMAGLPGYLALDVLYQMSTESGGNPYAVNRSDSNWLAGHPSVGLMQVIHGTYAAYGAPRVGYPAPVAYGVSEQPLANIYAAVNYGAHNGRGFGTGPGQIGSGHGYASGGLASTFGPAESAEKTGYGRLVAAYRYDLAHAKPGSWTAGHRRGITSELGTLGRRQAAEEAAYSAVIANRGSLSHFATTVREETATSHDIDLSHSHPALSKGLQSELATLLRLAGAPGGSGSGSGSGSGGKPHDPGKAALIAAQAGVRAKYAGLTRSIQADLAHAKKGSWTASHRKTIENELATLRARMNAESAAYATMAGAGFRPAYWPKLASAARAELRTASDQGLTAVHPLFARDLRMYLARIADVKPPVVRGVPGAGGGPGGQQPKLSFAAYLAALEKDQASEVANYTGLEAAFAKDLKHPKKGTWLYKNRVGLGERLYAVALKQKSEAAAYAALLAHSSGTVADTSALPGRLSQMRSTALTEKGALQPSLLGHVPGGHPGWTKNLGIALSRIAGLSVAGKVTNPAWNPGNLGPVHSVGGGVLQFDTGRGVLPPGLSLTWNGTGRPEPLSRPGGGECCGGVSVHLTVNGPVGSQAELENWLVKSANKLARTGRLSQAVKTAAR